MKPVRCGCGGEPIVGHIEKTSYLPKDRWYIGCPECDICTKTYDTEAEAIEAWNKALSAKDINVPTKDNLISRQDAIKALGDAHFQNYGNAIMIIQDLPSAEPERKWIPVTEALPKNSEHDWVLGQIRETDSGYLWIPCQVEYRQIKDDWYEESIGWMKENPDHAFEVIAWMPLPKPYRGDR